MVGNLYRHKKSGEYLRLIKLREQGPNLYLQVDAGNNPIIKKRGWSVRPQPQNRLVTGFEKLTLIKKIQDGQK